LIFIDSAAGGPQMKIATSAPAMPSANPPAGNRYREA
jgi:hypothetical protein